MIGSAVGRLLCRLGFHKEVVVRDYFHEERNRINQLKAVLHFVDLKCSRCGRERKDIL